MKIKKLTVTGLRAVPPETSVTANLKPLSLVIGPNASGKTTLLNAVKALADKGKGLTIDDTYSALGTSIKINAETCFTLGKPDEFSHSLRNEIWRAINSATIGREPSERMEEYQRILNYLKHSLSLPLHNEDNTTICFDIEYTLDFISRINGLTSIKVGKEVLKNDGDPTANYVYNILSFFISKKVGERTIVIPERFTEEGIRFVKNVMNRLLTQGRVKTGFADRLQEYLGLAGKYTELRIDPSESEGKINIKLYDGYAGHWVDLNRAAGGTIAALPIMVALAYAEEGDVVIIDDVDAGLHPAAQRKIAGAMVDAVNRGVQVIASTHSPVVLDSIVLSVLKRKIPEESVGVLLTYRGPRGLIRVAQLPARPPITVDENVERALKEVGASSVFGELSEISEEIGRALSEE